MNRQMFQRLTHRRRLPSSIAVIVFISLIIATLFVIQPREMDSVPESPLDRYFRQPNSTDHEVVNPHPFRFLLNPGNHMCSVKQIFLLVYVHSAPMNAERRQIIRKSWGNATQFSEPVRVVFVMGVPSKSNMSTEDLIHESNRYGDIVQEDFIDTYYNITYKAVAGLRWVTHHCPQASFVLKTDDDAFVNMFLLLDLLTRMSRMHPSALTQSIMCNLWRDSVPRTGKWKLDRSEFRYDEYPLFCQGLAYVMSGDVIVLLYRATYHVPFLRMDDVYLTGFVVLRLDHIRHIEMNSYYDKSTRLWVHDPEHWMDTVFAQIKNVEEIVPFWNVLRNFVLEIDAEGQSRKL